MSLGKHAGRARHTRGSYFGHGPARQRLLGHIDKVLACAVLGDERIGALPHAYATEPAAGRAAVRLDKRRKRVRVDEAATVVLKGEGADEEAREAGRPARQARQHRIPVGQRGAEAGRADGASSCVVEAGPDEVGVGIEAGRVGRRELGTRGRGRDVVLPRGRGGEEGSEFDGQSVKEGEATADLDIWSITLGSCPSRQYLTPLDTHRNQIRQ